MDNDLLAGLRSAAWLEKQTFPALSWIVKGLIPEGFTLMIGGPKIGKSWLSLDIALAVASAAAEHAFHRPLIALGEVGLSGEVRRVAGVERRIAEAARLGFGLALVPPGSTIGLRGMRAVEVGTVAAAVDLLQLRPPKRRDPEAPRLRLAE